jgi:uncharacterized DUF497 family protein
MPFYLFHWNDVNEAYLSQHDVTSVEFESVVCDPDFVDSSYSSGRKIAFGEVDGRFLACVYEQIDETTVLPVTAYEID